MSARLNLDASSLASLSNPVLPRSIFLSQADNRSSVSQILGSECVKRKSVTNRFYRYLRMQGYSAYVGFDVFMRMMARIKLGHKWIRKQLIWPSQRWSQHVDKVAPALDRV